jgi:general secretion pathway protein D
MLLTVSLLSSLLWAPLAVPAAPAPQDPVETEIGVPAGVTEQDGEYIWLRFSEVEGQQLRYDQLIKLCQKLTGKNFTIDVENSAVKTRLENPVILYGPKRIKTNEFYAFFQTLMKINGLVCVQQGSGDLSIIMITADKISGTAVNPTVTANTILVEPDDTKDFADQPGTYIATVVKLDFVDPGGISVALGKLLGANAQSTVQALTTDNALMIQGYGPVVASTVRFVRYLDVKPEIESAVFRKVALQEASAEEMAELLTEIVDELAATGDGAQRNVSSRTRNNNQSVSQDPIETRILASTRDNSLIITASQENLDRILDLIAELDTRVDVPESNLHLYVLQHIPVQDLDEPLQDFLQRADAAEQEAQQSGGSTINTREQDIVVEMQETTNSLLVSATRTKWAELKLLLDRLDQPQPQVLIETALIEISESFGRDIGFEWANAKTPGDGVLRGSVTTNSGITQPDANGDRTVDIFQSGITAGILDGQGNDEFAIPFILRAAQNSQDANVLSKPSVLVSNNKGARVTSTDQVPYTVTTQGQVGFQESVEFAEAGITLYITPSISSSNFLRLSISLSVSTFSGDAIGNQPPPISERTIDTEVLVPDGATMWIGGIVRDDKLSSRQGIPFLSDIPILGILFGQDSNSNSKTTLFFFCTPRIINEFAELQAESEAAKAIAAETIGLDRLRKVDPNFARETPADVILNGEDRRNIEPGSFNAPTLVSPNGEQDPNASNVVEEIDPLTLSEPVRRTGEPSAKPASASNQEPSQPK